MADVLLSSYNQTPVIGTWSTWIDPKVDGAATQTNFNTILADVAQVGCGYLQSASTINSEVGWDIDLVAGTYSFYIFYFRASNRGIATLSLDAVSIGTMDFYGVSTANLTASITGVVVATSGKKRFLIKMASKNASSGAYYGIFSMIYIKRTA